MGTQNLKRDHIKRAQMGRGQMDPGAAPFVGGLQKPAGAQAPWIAGVETHKAEFRARGAQVVADVFRIGKEFCRHHSTDSMAALILNAGVAMAVAKEPGDRVRAAKRQGFVQDIQAWIRCHGVLTGWMR